MAKVFGGMRARTGAAVLALAAGFFAGAAQAADYVVAAGSEVGTYFPVAGALKLLLADNKSASAPRLVPTATAGAVENLEGLLAKRFDFAIVQADQLFDAFQGRGAFAKGGPATELRTVLALHSESLALLVRKGAKIKGVEDLAGKKVDLGVEGSGGRATADALVAALGKPVKPVALRMGETVTALCDKKIDAALMFVGHPSAALLDGVTRCKNKLVPVAGPAAEKLADANPALGVVEIPERMYPGVAKAVPTIGTRAVLVTRGDVDAAAVGAVVKAARDNFDTLRMLHPALLSLGDVERLRPMSGAVPLHPAAEAAFEAR
jgi:uncharacterized protein